MEKIEENGSNQAKILRLVRAIIIKPPDLLSNQTRNSLFVTGFCVRAPNNCWAVLDLTHRCLFCATEK
jgi:hypothetical protein